MTNYLPPPETKVMNIGMKLSLEKGEAVVLGMQAISENDVLVTLVTRQN